MLRTSAKSSTEVEGFYISPPKAIRQVAKIQKLKVIASSRKR